MRSLGGLVLLAGVGVGLFVYLPAPVDRNLSLGHVSRFDSVRSETLPAKPTVKTATGGERLRAFAPGISLASLAPAQRITIAAAGPADGRGDWREVVTTRSETASSASLMPNDPAARYKLITDIQQQLKRLGCYYGRIDGDWGVGSKDAMRSFTERVNAELPIDEPDYLLLTLLQSHNGKVCGECPPGLEFGANGQCVPQATIAQSRPGDGTPQSAGSGETLPWKAASVGAPPATGRPLFTPVGTSVVSSEPLPGRMAIGGPKDLPPVNSAYTKPVIMPTGNANHPVATATLESGGPAHSRASAPRRSSYSGRSEPRYDAVRHNLMLSLGGVY
jgi:peptidoglycan hydrolase-like protein with peptidoglycan-binding domain